MAHRGGDVITSRKGQDRVDRGEGIDNEDLLVDIEFIQFADVKIATETIGDN